jgi:hypothetical protein
MVGSMEQIKYRRSTKHMKTKEDLLKEYISYRSGFIHEFSGNISESLIDMLKDAREYADNLGIEWDNSFVDETDWLSMNDFNYPINYNIDTVLP